jgi:hypothetical protein
VRESAAKQAKLQALRNKISETKAAQQKKEDEMQVLKEQMAKVEESQLKITELLEVLKITKSNDGKVTFVTPPLAALVLSSWDLLLDLFRTS